MRRALGRWFDSWTKCTGSAARGKTKYDSRVPGRSLRYRTSRSRPRPYTTRHAMSRSAIRDRTADRRRASSDADVVGYGEGSTTGRG